MYHVGEGARPGPFPITGNGHGRVTEPKGDQFSGRNLGMIRKMRNESVEFTVHNHNAIPASMVHNWIFLGFGIPLLKLLDG